MKEDDIVLLRFSGDMIGYTENPKESVDRKLELINKCSQFIGYKINIKNKHISS